MNDKSKPGQPNCNTCRHHMVTWDVKNPRGCRAYGFKSRQAPQQVVEAESGMPCKLYEPRPVNRSSRARS